MCRNTVAPGMHPDWKETLCEVGLETGEVPGNIAHACTLSAIRKESCKEPCHGHRAFGQALVSVLAIGSFPGRKLTRTFRAWAAYLFVGEGVVVVQPFNGPVDVFDELIHHGHGQVLPHHSPQHHHMPAGCDSPLKSPRFWQSASCLPAVPAAARPPSRPSARTAANPTPRLAWAFPFRPPEFRLLQTGDHLAQDLTAQKRFPGA